MAEDSSHDEEAIPDPEETQNLLANSNTDTHDDVTSHSSKSPSPSPAPLRQSSFAHPRPDGTPRTPNRVRFDVNDSPTSERHANGNLHPDWVDDEDFLIEEGIGRGRRQSDAQRLPLLTDIEAPSVTVALEHSQFNAEEHLETARPKSGMRSAFMNMANSIM
jgi:sodium-coupled neutral amino acid transporter 11